MGGKKIGRNWRRSFLLFVFIFLPQIFLPDLFNATT